MYLCQASLICPPHCKKHHFQPRQLCSVKVAIVFRCRKVDLRKYSSIRHTNHGAAKILIGELMKELSWAMQLRLALHAGRRSHQSSPYQAARMERESCCFRPKPTWSSHLGRATRSLPGFHEDGIHTCLLLRTDAGIACSSLCAAWHILPLEMA